MVWQLLQEMSVFLKIPVTKWRPYLASVFGVRIRCLEDASIQHPIIYKCVGWILYTTLIYLF